PLGFLSFSPDSQMLASSHFDCTILTWDLSAVTGQRKWMARQSSTQELQSWWADLTSPDARKVHTAIWSLAAAPEQAVPLLRARLRPALPLPPLPAEKVQRLI